jgi:soluble lytic murein transglycosylase-like protein
VAVAALGVLVEPSCRLNQTQAPTFELPALHALAVAGLPAIAAPAPAEFTAPTTPPESTIHVSAGAEAAGAPALSVETDQPAAAEPAPVEAPSAPIPAPAAPAGWQAPNVTRRPFDPEIERWRPLVRQELARAWSEGRLTGGASKLDDDVVLALIEQESAGDAEAESWAGAIGLTQVMPFTFADIIYGDESLADTLDPAVMFDPQLNVRAGIRYLAMAMQIFRGNLYWSLSSYNAGIGAVQDWRAVGLPSVPPIGGYVETADYAPPILANLAAHRPGLVVNIPPPMTDDEVADAIDRLVNAGLW